jgi:anti-sigma regulatory factor (Ser/Thr protein kinase)
VLDRGAETLDDGIFEFDAPPSHLGDRGRGLFLIKAFTDEARVTQPEGGGTCITIVKRKPAPGDNDEA